MKKQDSKKLLLNKQTVSVLKSKEMVMVKGGAIGTFQDQQQQSDSFVACGSCFTDCRTNSTVCGGDSLAF
jgi:glyceraldehyde-3-phosphate dehydrogenase/erythrose-4-phosphate dehydrogenase